jgi:hypothetical protein
MGGRKVSGAPALQTLQYQKCRERWRIWDPIYSTLYRVGNALETLTGRRVIHPLKISESLVSHEGSKDDNTLVNCLPRRVNAAPPIFEYVPR